MPFSFRAIEPHIFLAEITGHITGDAVLAFEADRMRALSLAGQFPYVQITRIHHARMVGVSDAFIRTLTQHQPMPLRYLVVTDSLYVRCMVYAARWFDDVAVSVVRDTGAGLREARALLAHYRAMP